MKWKPVKDQVNEENFLVTSNLKFFLNKYLQKKKAFQSPYRVWNYEEYFQYHLMHLLLWYQKFIALAKVKPSEKDYYKKLIYYIF